MTRYKPQSYPFGSTGDAFITRALRAPMQARQAARPFITGRRMQRIYLDHAATTPLDPRVLDAMLPVLKESFGNASSVHALGRRARVLVEEARETVAARLGAEPSEVIFTSGATESNNLALVGTVGRDFPRVVTTAAEHESVLRTADRMQREGRPVTILPVDGEGRARVPDVAAAVAGEPCLLSMMHANNETGALSPLQSVRTIIDGKTVLVHVDAVQTAGYPDWTVQTLGVDLVSISAHKIGGPKGVGALYVRSGVELTPQLTGGAQERGRRAGTENVAGIVGLARAVDLAATGAGERRRHLVAMRRHLIGLLDQAFGGRFVHNTPTPEDAAVPHIVSISFPPGAGGAVDGEMLLLSLDLEGIQVSAGSACTSGALEPSHVLLATGRDRATAAATLRFSMSHLNTEAELDAAVVALDRILRRMGVFRNAVAE